MGESSLPNPIGPVGAPHLPFWLLGGKARFKDRIASRVVLDPAGLPYREEVLSRIKAARGEEREVVLASAADHRIVGSIANHLGLFSHVLASDGVTNLSGANKLRAIRDFARNRAFDYVGDSRDDLPIWRESTHAILVVPSRRVLRQVQRMNGHHEVIVESPSGLRAALIELRMHQWVKNFLVFVPLIMAHRITDGELLAKAGMAFVCFCACASSVYVLNDLMDLEADRAHPAKRSRPLASGALRIPVALAMIPFLLLIAFGLAVFAVSWPFLGMVVLYLVITTCYSFGLKRVLIVDVMVLAGLYTLRIIAGAVAVAVTVSPWLFAFSMFLFVSLAFLKRYAELRLMQARNVVHQTGRGYIVEDLQLLQSLGSSSGYLSILVLALYTNSREVATLYHRPAILWLIGLVLLYWVTRMWFKASRGLMPDDPIAFAVRDPMSYALGLFVAVILVVAALPA